MVVAVVVVEVVVVVVLNVVRNGRIGGDFSIDMVNGS